MAALAAYQLAACRPCSADRTLLLLVCGGPVRLHGAAAVAVAVWAKHSGCLPVI